MFLLESQQPPPLPRLQLPLLIGLLLYPLLLLLLRLLRLLRLLLLLLLL